MISQPQVEPANNTGARTMLFLSSFLAEAPLLGSCCTTPFSDRTKNKARRGNPAGLGYTPEGYLFIHESRYTSRSRKLHYVDTWGPAGVWLARRTRTKRGGQRYSQLFTDQRRVFPLKLQ
jgi:hypothetical protein